MWEMGGSTLSKRGGYHDGVLSLAGVRGCVGNVS